MIAPPFLKKGDTIGIVALASKVNFEELQAAIQLLENWGLTALVGESVHASFHNFAGTDSVRRQDFQQMLNNPNIQAIASARGGYGSSRIIDDIDFSDFLQNPKWIIGFSDITAVHGKIQSLGYQSIHSVMPKTMLLDTWSDETLKNILFGKSIDYTIKSEVTNRNGTAEGQLIGGNLAILVHCIGTDSDLDYNGKILFIEDIDEYYYSIDRMMVQLKRSGKLANLAGLVVGQFSDCKDNSEPFGKSVFEIIAEHTHRTNYPIAFNFPIGHTAQNWAVRCGEKMKLCVTENEVSLKSITEKEWA